MTIETLQQIALSDLTAPAFVGFFVLGVLTGQIVPKKTVERLIGFWMKAYENEREARKELQKSHNKLIQESGETSKHLMESLPTIEEVEEAKEETPPTASPIRNLFSSLKKGRET